MLKSRHPRQQNPRLKINKFWSNLTKFLLIFLLGLSLVIYPKQTRPALSQTSIACVPNVFYASEFGGSRLFGFDINNGDITTIGNLLFSTAAISRDGVTGFVYYIEDISTNPRVAYFDPVTSSNVVVGSTGTTGFSFVKMAQQASTSNIYAAGNDNNIYTINPTTGVATLQFSLSGTIGVGSGDIAFDPKNLNSLYLTRQTPANQVQLWLINVSTGTATLVGTTAVAGGLDTGALAFGPDGELYMDGYTPPGAGANTFRQYRWNTSTGTVTEVFNRPLTGAYPGFRDFGTLPNLTPSVNLTVTKEASSGAVIPGSPLSYTIRVTNNGDCNLSGLAISDNLPPDLQSPTWSSQIVSSANELLPGIGTASPSSGSGSTITTTVSLSVGSQLIIRVNGTLRTPPPALPPNLENTVVVTPPPGINFRGTSPSACPVGSPPGSFCSQSSIPIIATAFPDLEVLKTGPATAERGKNITYTIRVRNIGNAPATNVQVTDTTSLGLAFVSNSGDCTTAFPCSLGTLAPGGSRTITSTFAIDVTAAAPFDNTARASSTEESLPGYPAGLLVNNTSKTSSLPSATSGGGGGVVIGGGTPATPPPVTAGAEPDLTVAITVPPTATPGSNVTVNLTASNIGNASADNTVITYELPPGAVFVSADPACTVSGNIISCNVGTLAAGSSSPSFGIVIKLPDTPTTLTSVARVSTTTPESNTSNNTASAQTVTSAGSGTGSGTGSGSGADSGTGGGTGITTIPGGLLIPLPGGGTVTTPIPAVVGAALSAGPPISAPNGTEIITFVLSIANTSNQSINNLQALVDLASAFAQAQGFAVVGPISVTGLTSQAGPGGVLTNAGFNGVNNFNLLAPGVSLGPGGTAIITFQVQVSPGSNLGPYFVSAVVTGTTPNGVVVADVSTSGTNPDANNNGDPGDDSIPTPVTFNGVPNLRLVKRITNVFRGGTTLPNLNFNVVVDDPSDTNDNLATWGIPLTGLVRIDQNALIQSGDELEYTVYFLSDGTGPLRNFLFCDLVPQLTAFSGDSYGPGQGVLLRLNGVEIPQVNANSFLPPLTPAPSPCANPNNPTGAVFLQVPVVSNRSPNNVGLVRFRVRVQ